MTKSNANPVNASRIKRGGIGSYNGSYDVAAIGRRKSKKKPTVPSKVKSIGKSPNGHDVSNRHVAEHDARDEAPQEVRGNGRLVETREAEAFDDGIIIIRTDTDTTAKTTNTNRAKSSADVDLIRSVHAGRKSDRLDKRKAGRSVSRARADVDNFIRTFAPRPEDGRITKETNVDECGGHRSKGVVKSYGKECNTAASAKEPSEEMGRNELHITEKKDEKRKTSNENLQEIKRIFQDKLRSPKEERDVVVGRSVPRPAPETANTKNPRLDFRDHVRSFSKSDKKLHSDHGNKAIVTPNLPRTSRQDNGKLETSPTKSSLSRSWTGDKAKKSSSPPMPSVITTSGRGKFAQYDRFDHHRRSFSDDEDGSWSVETETTNVNTNNSILGILAWAIQSQVLSGINAVEKAVSGTGVLGRDPEKYNRAEMDALEDMGVISDEEMSETSVDSESLVEDDDTSSLGDGDTVRSERSGSNVNSGATSNLISVGEEIRPIPYPSSYDVKVGVAIDANERTVEVECVNIDAVETNRDETDASAHNKNEPDAIKRLQEEIETLRNELKTLQRQKTENQKSSSSITEKPASDASPGDMALKPSVTSAAFNSSQVGLKDAAKEEALPDASIEVTLNAPDTDQDKETNFNHSQDGQKDAAKDEELPDASIEVTVNTSDTDQDEEKEVPSAASDDAMDTVDTTEDKESDTAKDIELANELKDVSCGEASGASLTSPAEDVAYAAKRNINITKDRAKNKVFVHSSTEDNVDSENSAPTKPSSSAVEESDTTVSSLSYIHHTHDTEGKEVAVAEAAPDAATHNEGVSIELNRKAPRVSVTRDTGDSVDAADAEEHIDDKVSHLNATEKTEDTADTRQAAAIHAGSLEPSSISTIEDTEPPKDVTGDVVAIEDRSNHESSQLVTKKKMTQLSEAMAVLTAELAGLRDELSETLIDDVSNVEDGDAALQRNDTTLQTCKLSKDDSLSYEEEYDTAATKKDIVDVSAYVSSGGGTSVRDETDSNTIEEAESTLVAADESRGEAYTKTPQHSCAEESTNTGKSDRKDTPNGEASALRAEGNVTADSTSCEASTDSATKYALDAVEVSQGDAILRSFTESVEEENSLDLAKNSENDILCTLDETDRVNETAVLSMDAPCASNVVRAESTDKVPCDTNSLSETEFDKVSIAEDDSKTPQGNDAAELSSATDDHTSVGKDNPTFCLEENGVKCVRGEKGGKVDGKVSVMTATTEEDEDADETAHISQVESKAAVLVESQQSLTESTVDDKAQDEAKGTTDGEAFPINSDQNATNVFQSIAIDESMGSARASDANRDEACASEDVDRGADVTQSERKEAVDNEDHSLITNGDYKGPVDADTRIEAASEEALCLGNEKDLVHAFDITDVEQKDTSSYDESPVRHEEDTENVANASEISQDKDKDDPNLEAALLAIDSTKNKSKEAGSNKNVQSKAKEADKNKKASPSNTEDAVDAACVIKEEQKNGSFVNVPSQVNSTEEVANVEGNQDDWKDGALGEADRFSAKNNALDKKGNIEVVTMQAVDTDVLSGKLPLSTVDKDLNVPSQQENDRSVEKGSGATLSNTSDVSPSSHDPELDLTINTKQEAIEIAHSSGDRDFKGAEYEANESADMTQSKSRNAATRRCDLPHLNITNGATDYAAKATHDTPSLLCVAKKGGSKKFKVQKTLKLWTRKEKNKTIPLARYQ